MSTLDELDVIVRRRGSRVIVGIPEVQLYSSADDLQTALAKLDQKKQALREDLVAAGEPDEFESYRREPTATGDQRSSRRDLIQFASKAAIAALIFVVAGTILADQIESAIKRSAPKGGSAFWARMEGNLAKMADPKTDLPPEKKEKILADIRAIVARWRPFVAEIAPLFSDQGPPSRSTPLPGAK